MKLRVGAAVVVGVSVGLISGAILATAGYAPPASYDSGTPASGPSPQVFLQTEAPVIDAGRIDIQQSASGTGNHGARRGASGSRLLRTGIGEAEGLRGAGEAGSRLDAREEADGDAPGDLPESFEMAQAMPPCETGAIPGINFQESALTILQGGTVTFSDATSPFIPAEQVSVRTWEIFTEADPFPTDIANDQDDGVLSCAQLFPSQPPDPAIPARIQTTDSLVTTACFQFLNPGVFTVRFTIQTNAQFPGGAVTDCITRNMRITVSPVTDEMNGAGFAVTDLICQSEGSGILPGNEWIPLVQIQMDYPSMSPAPRFLQTLDFRILTADNLAPAGSAVQGGDARLFEENILEFGVFIDRGPNNTIPDQIFNLADDGMIMQGEGLITGVPFLRWEADGSPDMDLDNSSESPPTAPGLPDMFASDITPPGPAGAPDRLHYIMDFVNDHRDLDSNPATPYLPFASLETVTVPATGNTVSGLVQRYLSAGVAEIGLEGYIIAMRLNQSIQHRQSIHVFVDGAEMVTVGPVEPPFNQPTPGAFPVGTNGPVDSYQPDFFMGVDLNEACGRVMELEIWDYTGAIAGPYDPDAGSTIGRNPDLSANLWNWPNRLYTPVSEFVRPRFDLTSLAFDVFGGEYLDLRRVFALEQWIPVVGMNAHSTGGQPTEVNMIFTDIGADPFGPPGNGGFDPRQGLETFTTSAGGGALSPLGDDYTFNGVWMFHDFGSGATQTAPCPGDCNGNGVFDPPVQLAGGGVDVSGTDRPMLPDLRFPLPDQSIPGLLEWEYIPFPPGGGDPWWKIKLRFAGGARIVGGEMCTGELEWCQEVPPFDGALDYYVTLRADSGFRDISLRSGDGVGLPLGADFRAFVEPRRTNPLTGLQDGGIFFGPTFPGTVGPTTSPTANTDLDNFPDVRSVDFPQENEPWWHERYINRNNVKPLRSGIEVHDLVVTLNSDNVFAKETSAFVGDGTTFQGEFPLSFSLDAENLFPLSDIPFSFTTVASPTYFDLWIDPFRVLRQHFFNRNSVGVLRDLSDAFAIPFDNQYNHQWSFESTPFFNFFLDGDNPLLQDQPRSPLYTAPQAQPTIPGFNPFDADPNESEVGEWPPQFFPLAGNIGPLSGSGSADGFVSFANDGGTPGDESDDVYQFAVAGENWIANQFAGNWLIDQKMGKYRIISNTNNTLMIERGQTLQFAQFEFSPPSGSRWLIVEDTLQRNQYTRITDWPLGYKGVFVDDDNDGFQDEIGGRSARILKQHVDTPDPLMEALGFTGQTAMLGINVVAADDIIVNSNDAQRLFLERLTVAFWGPDFDPRRDLQSLEASGTSTSSGVLLFEDAGPVMGDGAGVIYGDGVFGGEALGDRIVPLKDLAWPLQPELIDLDGDLVPDDLSGDGIVNPPGVGQAAVDLNGDGTIDSGDGLDLAWVLRMIPDDAWVVPFTDSTWNNTATIPVALPFGGFPSGDPNADGIPVEPGDADDMDDPQNLINAAQSAHALSSYLAPAATAAVQTLPGSPFDYGAAPSNAAQKALNTVNNEGDDLFVVIQTSRNIARFKQFRALVPARLPARTPNIQQVAGIEFRPINFPRVQAFEKSNPDEGAVQDFFGHDMLEANVPVSVINLVEPDDTAILPGGPPRAILGIDASTNRGTRALLGAGTGGSPSGVTSYTTPSRDWTGPAHDPNEVVDHWLVAMNEVDNRLESYRINGFNGTTLMLDGGRPDGSQWRVVRDATFLEQVIVELYDAGGDRDFNIIQDLLPLDFEDPDTGVFSGVSIYRDNPFDANPATNGVFDPGDLPIDLDDPPILVGVIGEPETQVKFTFSSPGTDSLPLDGNGNPVSFIDQPRLRQIIPDSFGLNPSDPDFGPDFFIVIRTSLDMDEGDDFSAGIVSWGPNTPTEPDPDQFTDPTAPLANLRVTDFDIFSEFPWGTRALGFITYFKDAPRTSFWTWDKDLQRQVVREEIDNSQNHPDPVNPQTQLNASLDRYWVRSTANKFGVSDTLVALPPPNVDFDADVRRAEVDAPIQFTNLSEVDAASFLWDFGDGNTSTLENPTHSYAAESPEGGYTVSLTITTPSGLVITETKPGFIEILDAPFADFRADPTSGQLACNPLTGNDEFDVVFTDQSVTGPGLTIIDRVWDFGDNTMDVSNNPMPTHTYTTSGAFTVQLTVTFSNGTMDTCMLTDVVIIAAPPTDRPDSDGDGAIDECDRCPDFDDSDDDDMDGVPDGCDLCPDFDDAIDTDLDGVPDDCDLCPGGDDALDSDGDTVPDACDLCDGIDDTIDADNDGIPDCADICPGSDDMIDTDADGVPDGCDLCPDFDDNVDTDLDTVPDGCDLCPGEDDLMDADGDTIPDACDLCDGEDDSIDTDMDGVPDCADQCPGEDDSIDADGDSVPDACDVCPGGDDLIDTDLDGVPDACDICPGEDDTTDQDGDTVPDACDLCPGEDDMLDSDLDGVPDGCDLCEGFNDAADEDLDGVPDGCDLCPGEDDTQDEDNDGIPDACDDGTASFEVQDSISAGPYDRNTHALVPLMDWMPLFNFRISPDNDDPTSGTVAERFMESLTYSIIFDPEFDDRAYNAVFAPQVSDLLEFALFREEGLPDEDQDGSLDEVPGPQDTLLFTWRNTGEPVGQLLSNAPGNIVYRLDFIGNGSPTSPQFPVPAGATADGQSYIVGFRTSATWRSKIGMSYEVLDARMTPFPLDDMGEAEDSYTPDFPGGEILDEVGTAYSSNFEIYDATGGPIDNSIQDSDVRLNSWNYPISLYTPHAEFSRPRPDLGQTLFDFVNGETLSLREILPLDAWAPLISINLHSSFQPQFGDRALIHTEDGDPDLPLVDLREVNVVLTDIGGDPFGAEGNGGFNPITGLENFFDPREGFSVVQDLAIGEDFAFNGVWLWIDGNDNGIFDAPTPNGSGGASLNGDFPLDPDLFAGHFPQWEYIPFPPGGGDPWWKVRLRFFGGSIRAGAGAAGFVENIPEDNEFQQVDGFFETSSFFERVDYFVVARTDSGYRDVSLLPGDNNGILPGADFKAFIEPRRLNPLTGSFEGGIHLDSMIPASDFFFGQTPWQDDPRWRNMAGGLEPWWPERTQSQIETKPSRTGIEVHDLVMLYRSRNPQSQNTEIPFTLAGVGFSTWLDPFGLVADQFLNPREIGVQFWDINVIFSITDLGNDTGAPFNLLLSNERRQGRHEVFETIPFVLPEVDFPPFGPRSSFFPAEALPDSPTLPSFASWPAAVGDAQAYPHFTDWAPEEREARLLRQHVDSESQLTAMLGFNLAGSNDPEVNRVNRPVLDEIYVAMWGPDFTPADLLPLDPEGDDADSGAMLWADSLDIGYSPGDGVNDSLPDGVFRGLPISTAFLDDPFLTDRIVPLSNLRWQNAPEPVDLDGDGLADDMNGDEIVDQRDHAWVLQLTPQAALPVPLNDQDVGDGFNMLPDGTVDPTGPVNAHGDELFFVVRTSKSVSRFEQFRAFVPATLPSRPTASLRAAGIRTTPQGTAIASAYFKSHPEEQVAFNFYDHDMLKVNIPTDISNLVPRNTQIVSGGPAFPVFGLDVSTNRADGTVETGASGTGGLRSFVDDSKTWPVDTFSGKFLVDDRYNSFEIVSNSATRLTLRNGTPSSGAYRIVREPSFLEQLIVEVYRGSPGSGFRLAADLLPLSQDQRVSGVAIYRDNDRNPQNRNGVFDPGIDIPITLDAVPRPIGIGGQPDAQIKFVFSTPGTDEWPSPLRDQPSNRQWVPDTFGRSVSDEFSGADFFIIVRPSRNLDDGDDFRMGLVSWGPNTPTEPDPDTFASDTQPPDEFSKFSEFPFGNRAIGYITFVEEPETRFWMREARAFSEPEPDRVNWVRSSTTKKALSGTLTARDAIVSPTSIEVDSLSNTQIPSVIPDGDTFELVIRGTNFGANPTVVIEGYDVTIVSSSDDAINVELRNIPGVTPNDPLVIIITNPETGEVFSQVGLVSLTGSRPASMQLNGVDPASGRRGDFPVTVRGVNFNALEFFEVYFGETSMPVVSVNTLGNLLESGENGSAVDELTFSDIVKAWEIDEFVGRYLIDSTNGTFEILANDSDTLTLRPGTRTPASGAYGIYDSDEFAARVNFPEGGLPKTGAQDVTVRNVNENDQVLSEDTMLRAFMFIDDPARPCFIATAAYGSPLEAELDTFRHFRDSVLLKSAAGVTLVETYYRVSPVAAEFIAERPALAAAVRVVLTPVAWSLTHAVPTLALVLCAGVAGAGVVRRRRIARTA